MATVELNTDQIVNLVQQLPAERKREVLFTLAADADIRREARMTRAAEGLRRLATERGLEWDTMTEEQRETFVDQLVHEDRSCEK